MKTISSRLTFGLMLGWLLLARPVTAQTSANTTMEPLPDDSAELVVYSDTCTFDENGTADTIVWSNNPNCVLTEDDSLMWNFFSDVLGTGAFLAFLIAALLFIGLPLLALILLFFLIYRSTRTRETTAETDTLKAGIRQASIGIALVVTELWIGLGGVLGCVGVFLICWAGGRILIDRITTRRHATQTGPTPSHPEQPEEGAYQKDERTDRRE